MNIYLASNSIGRKKLLDSINFDYKFISHSYNEIVEDESIKTDLEKYVLYVSKNKLYSINYNLLINEKEEFIIATVDTMCGIKESDKVKSLKLIGKPKSIDEARILFNSYNNKQIDVSTGYCISLCKISENQIKFIKIIQNCVSSKVFMFMNDNDINEYISKFSTEILSYSGGITVEGFAQKYIKRIEGSYSSIIGLPLYEFLKDLRQIQK